MPQKVSLPIEQTAGKISGEFVMCYPPGIPILAPGEMVTQEIVEYILYARDKGCSMQGMEDPKVEHLQVLKGVSDHGIMVFRVPYRKCKAFCPD